jgi:two-component system nitrogen regulation response regulator NtrX
MNPGDEPMSNRERYAVLTVDDDAAIRRMLRAVLTDEGHETGEAATAAEAYAALEQRRYDAVLLDLTMPGEHGLDALVRIREQAPDTAVIVVSGESTLENALRAGQRGAFDFVAKPIRDPDHLLELLHEAVRVTRLRRGTEARESARTPDTTREAGDLGILGRSPAIERLREADPSRRPGAGARARHGRATAPARNSRRLRSMRSRSARADRSLKLNCAAIPKDLLESELFGYEKGAFTGAVATKKGRLELADGGTLFLDEIGDLALDAQAKLLRVLETGDIERVGGTRTASVDVRLIAATNKDLPAAVRDGTFREDLWFRLNVLPLHVPPLRERRADITMLAEHFLALFAAAEGRAPLTLADDARALLEDYHWPGNVREMRNLMERAVVLVPGVNVAAADLDAWLESPPEESAEAGLEGSVARSEIESIRRALDAADWNVTQAAAGLGIDRTNLHRKMRKYGITRR